ncbi:MAG: putative portal protein [Prokaryotic dsDNA virus sp.]|nr:MAG: putative portal protein [Prokaryotic dsDNA virus sp.]|tara:strand:+ start:39382 stop:41151 length:1770 start_codon:yes stop_codon:yes gene_type:complete
MALTTEGVKVAELLNVIKQEGKAGAIVNLWSTYDDQRAQKVADWQEVRNYIFATDTETTSNSDLPWKNSTTLPKLCQIRDNLHSNYLSALFPNDDWLRWEAYSSEDNSKRKANTIEAYISNKAREGHMRTTMSKLLLDYIDYGISFATVDFFSEHKVMDNGDVVPGFTGPKVLRISPRDIVFNPLATSFADSWKIVRSIKTEGEVKRLARTNPEYSGLVNALEERAAIASKIGGYTSEDFEKADAYYVDGFGDLREYYQSGYIEFLEFYGDWHNLDTGELETDRVITIMDRRQVVRDEEIPSWLGKAPIYSVGWRTRPDNLWAMGPLDNLVGMQYRIDHLENLKADAMDLCVHPPLKVIGEVEEFVWGPGVEIQIDENGDVSELGKNLNGIFAASNDIDKLEAKMEMYAGTPREAMGIRTPGEKTAFEVQTLDNAAGRIFQEKITTFEIELLEPVLNAMLESARRNLDGTDVVRTLDDDLAVKEFLEITRDDITASGILRPIGARHFSAKAQLLQNLSSVMNSGIAAKIAPHISSIALAKTVEDTLGLERYKLFVPNVAVMEQLETQRLASQAQQILAEEQQAGIEEDV